MYELYRIFIVLKVAEWSDYSYCHTDYLLQLEFCYSSQYIFTVSTKQKVPILKVHL